MPCEPAEIKDDKLLIGCNATDTSGSPTIRPLPDGTVYRGSPNLRLLGGIDEWHSPCRSNAALTPNYFSERDALPNEASESGHGGRIYMS